MDIAWVLVDRLGSIKLIYDRFYVRLWFWAFSGAIGAAVGALAKLLFGFSKIFNEITRFEAHIGRHLGDLLVLILPFKVIQSKWLFATARNHLDSFFALLIVWLSFARFLHNLLAFETGLVAVALSSVVSERISFDPVSLRKLVSVRVGINRTGIVARIRFKWGLDDVWGVNVLKVLSRDGALQTGRDLSSVLVHRSVFQVHVGLKFVRYWRTI